MKVFICVAVCISSVLLSAFGETVPPNGSTDPSHVEKPVRCYQGSCWYLGPYFQFVPECVDGNCQCYAPNYNKITCLPCVGSCFIRKYEDDFSSVHAKPLDSSTFGSSILYSCVGRRGHQGDVHVLGVNEVYGQRHTSPPTAAAMNVSISSSSSLTRPIILVLTNYEPVNWILDVQPHLNIRKVILIAQYPDLSSVTTVSGVSQSLVVEKWPRSTPRGFGSDIGGGKTAEMLAILTEEFGGITSFAGIYQTESWELNLPSVCLEIYPKVAEATTHSTPAMPGTAVQTEPTPSYEVEPISCLDNSCWHVGPPLQFNASCVKGHCECNAPYYNKISCLPSVGSCKIRSLEINSGDLYARPSLFPLQPYTVYSCIGEGSTSADVHVIGVHEGSTKTQPPTASRIYVSISSTTGVRSVVFVLTNHEPVEWRLTYPPHLNIAKVILISHYPELSSVTTEFGESHTWTVEKRPSDAPGGYGTDREGGNTVGMLVDLTEEFGGVTSFAGTYKASYWFFNLTAIGDDVTPPT